jgi:hypothetical protein
LVVYFQYLRLYGSSIAFPNEKYGMSVQFYSLYEEWSKMVLGSVIYNRNSEKRTIFPPKVSDFELQKDLGDLLVLFWYFRDGLFAHFGFCFCHQRSFCQIFPFLPLIFLYMTRQTIKLYFCSFLFLFFLSISVLNQLCTREPATSMIFLSLS